MLAAAAKIAAAPQHQRLIQGLPEAMMALLHITILVRLPRLDLLPAQAIVVQQRLILPCEPLGAARRLHRGRQAIRAMPLRHSTQREQRVLQPLAQALEALRKADRPRLPVGIRQHEVVQQMRERLPGDGDLQLVQMAEIRLPKRPRVMFLGEEALLAGPATARQTLIRRCSVRNCPSDLSAPAGDRTGGRGADPSKRAAPVQSSRISPAYDAVEEASLQGLLRALYYL